MMPMVFGTLQVEDDEVMKYTLWGMIAAQGDINNAGQYYFHVSNLERPIGLPLILRNYVAQQ